MYSRVWCTYMCMRICKHINILNMHTYIHTRSQIFDHFFWPSPLNPKTILTATHCNTATHRNTLHTANWTASSIHRMQRVCVCARARVCVCMASVGESWVGKRGQIIAKTWFPLPVSTRSSFPTNWHTHDFLFHTGGRWGGRGPLFIFRLSCWIRKSSHEFRATVSWRELIECHCPKTKSATHCNTLHT